MRIEKSVTAISCIPSEAIEGLPKLPFELGKATLRATTRTRVAVVPGEAVDRDSLVELARDRR